MSFQENVKNAYSRTLAEGAIQLTGNIRFAVEALDMTEYDYWSDEVANHLLKATWALDPAYTVRLVTSLLLQRTLSRWPGRYCYGTSCNHDIHIAHKQYSSAGTNRAAGKGVLHRCRDIILTSITLSSVTLYWLEMCGNGFRVPIPSDSHDFVPIAIPGLEKS